MFWFTLGGGRDALGCALAFGCVGGRLLTPESFRNPHDLATERLQLELDALVLNPALVVEDARSRGNRDDVRHGPPAERPGRKLHGVDRLQALCSARGADQADHV